ncbi:phage virion morphogenesis protein [Ralstonia sp. SM1864_UCD524_TZ4]|uniref:Putative Bacteriophage protein, phage P2 Tail completion protein gpS n=1 Tax=Ralstonia solanacearum TaxID=305 RepID=A0A0S4XGE1_RALSL|nr:phage virion morphogenesis protein [Ralstonia pseudosolanacearum]CUV22205.1 putative Bacteriophage protein, phage P2 Tail completion protein gpS [Ralstonia solanacearum]CUV36568.1 putative Bacteriophage protein, phage P2 Tail completion protein gpS [Ralstonia solanacearum]CUV41335.1 putative Bacteriophage protein, phage P2 Tail completion protein gpS [Ralstonia solanacearum]CUV62283.1 putative Bacteriophage protein, phage P2 Tail completion protein gpS [Ralstonia solanacearum]
MSEFRELEVWLAGMLTKLDAPARRTLARAVAAELRRRQAARIAEQRNPDGSLYVPRKPQLRHRVGRIRRAMFMRLRLARYMKAEADANTAVVTFVNKARRIATVHHFGLRDRVNNNGLTAQYPARELLGLDEGNVECVTDTVLQHLSI